MNLQKKLPPVRCTDELKQRIEQAAKEQQLSVGCMMRILMISGLESYNNLNLKLKK